MANFDFITDDDFRSVLENDYQEMQRCFKSEAWKAVHVLAGSIIEAILIDSLVSEGHMKKEEALKADLGTIIGAAEKKKIISSKVSHLSSVLKEYRNLIHPGNSVRNKESPDDNGSRIALSLIDMILDEVSNQRQTTYGYTSEQIIGKIEKDSSAIAILSHLLKEVKSREIEKLLMEAIPSRYMRFVSENGKYIDESEEHIPSNLILLFRKSMEAANEKIKEKATKKFVKILKEDAEELVFSYGEAFFRMSDLAHLSDDEKKLVKEHFFERIKDEYANETLIQDVLPGIGLYIHPAEVNRFVDPLVRAMCTEKHLRLIVRERIKSEYGHMPNPDCRKLIERLDEWSNSLQSRGKEEFHRLVENLKSDIEDYIPF